MDLKIKRTLRVSVWNGYRSLAIYSPTLSGIIGEDSELLSKGRKVAQGID